MCGRAKVQFCTLFLAWLATADSTPQPANVVFREQMHMSSKYEEAPVFDVLKVHRATAYSLLLEVPCHHYCGLANVQFKLKRSRAAMWRSPPADIQLHPDFNDTFSLNGLQPDTSYAIRAVISPPGIYTPILQARTCPERPPPVTELRVAEAGPAWLDVRWTPPRPETCASAFEYLTRYKAGDGSFTPTRTYGVLPSAHAGFVLMRPAHPCPTWPRDFCLLLADDVQPAANHTVEVQVHRLGGRNNEKAEIQRVIGFADTRSLDPDVPEAGNSAPSSATTDGANSVRAWFIVTLVSLALFVILIAIVLAFLNSGLFRRRAQGALLSDPPPPPPSQPLIPRRGRSGSGGGGAGVGGESASWATAPPPRYEDVAFLCPPDPSGPSTPVHRQPLILR